MKRNKLKKISMCAVFFLGFTLVTFLNGKWLVTYVVFLCSVQKGKFGNELCFENVQSPIKMMSTRHVISDAVGK